MEALTIWTEPAPIRLVWISALWLSFWSCVIYTKMRSSAIWQRLAPPQHPLAQLVMAAAHRFVRRRRRPAGWPRARSKRSAGEGSEPRDEGRGWGRPVGGTYHWRPLPGTKRAGALRIPQLHRRRRRRRWSDVRAARGDFLVWALDVDAGEDVEVDVDVDGDPHPRPWPALAHIKSDAFQFHRLLFLGVPFSLLSPRAPGPDSGRRICSLESSPSRRGGGGRFPRHSSAAGARISSGAGEQTDGLEATFCASSQLAAATGRHIVQSTCRGETYQQPDKTPSRLSLTLCDSLDERLSNN